MYVENNVLNLKDFIGLNDEQKVSKIIYWEWKEETGDTEEEIHENDLKDSEFMGKSLEMAISVTGRQDVATSSNYCMVTLDANGGKIGSSALVQKQVTVGETYGELPTPTREGYTFMGWADAIKDMDRTGRMWAGSQVIDKEFMKKRFKANTKYILEYDIALEEPIPSGYEVLQSFQWGNVDFFTLEQDGKYSVSAIGGSNALYSQCGDNYVVGKIYHVKTNITTPEDLANAVIWYYTAICNEIGNTKLLYYINGTFSNVIFYTNIIEDTTIVESSNHTLTAIWKKN